jgi:hypothetical protein
MLRKLLQTRNDPLIAVIRLVVGVISSSSLPTDLRRCSAGSTDPFRRNNAILYGNDAYSRALGVFGDHGRSLLAAWG